MILFCPKAPGRRDHSVRSPARRPSDRSPERSSARSADGGSPESHAPAVDSGEPEAERKGLNGARIAMIRRPMADDPGRGVRLGQDRPGEASASAGSPGRPRMPHRCNVPPGETSVPRSASQAERSGDLGGHEDRNGSQRPPIPTGRASVTVVSRRRAWRQPWLSGEAGTADPFPYPRFPERRKAPGRRCLSGGGAPAETPERQQPEGAERSEGLK